MNKYLRYYVYIRKSTEREESQALSIPAQQHAIEHLVQQHKLHIVGKPFIESQTAKKPGRPHFISMMEGVRKGKADGILCWHLDRLARNPVDGGSILWAMSQGDLKEIVTPEVTYTPSADHRFMMTLHFGMATKYVDDLSRNIRRGNTEALRNGNWPYSVKIGYKRDRDTKKIVPDEKRFHVISYLFKMRLDGVPLRELFHMARNTYQLTTPKRKGVGGTLIAPSRFYAMFKDPFYTGMMHHDGKIYKGNHQPMLTQDEFFKIQQAQQTDKVVGIPKPKTLNFPYRGLITCGSCGAMVTAACTINRHGTPYMYYFCCRKNKKYKFCPEPYIQQKHLEEQFDNFIESIRLSDKMITFVSTIIKEIANDKYKDNEQLQAPIKHKISRNKQLQEKYLQLCAEGVITDEKYLKANNKLILEEKSLEEQLETCREKGQLIEPYLEKIYKLNNAFFLFKQKNPVQKRKILQRASLNPILCQKNVLFKPRKAIALLIAVSSFPSCGGNETALRTIIKHHIDEYIQSVLGLDH